MKTYISYGQEAGQRVVVDGKVDCVEITTAVDGVDYFVVLPETAVRALIRALEEYEESRRDSRLWGV